MADAKVSKTFDLNGRVGSTPTFGTNYLVRLGYFNNPDGDWSGVERAELSCPHNLYHSLWGQLNPTHIVCREHWDNLDADTLDARAVQL